MTSFARLELVRQYFSALSLNETIRRVAGCADHLFIRQRSGRHPDILVMQSADMLEFSHDALDGWLNDSLLGSVFR